MPRRLLTEPKSKRVADSIMTLLEFNAMSATQVAFALNESVQFASDYLPAMVELGMLYSAGNERKGQARYIKLYTSSPELKKHPNETVRLTGELSIKAKLAGR